MALPYGYPPFTQPVTRREDGRMTDAWMGWVRTLNQQGGQAAPSDAPYVLESADARLPDSRVFTSSDAIEVNSAIAGQIRADLSLTGVTPGTYGDASHAATFTVDDQGRLTAASEVSILPAFYMSPLTTGGDPAAAELVFSPDGDVVMVPVSF